MKTKHKSQDRKASPQPSPSSTTEPGKIETIFFSWQSDAPRPVNRSFIDSCLERAMKKVNELPDLKSANRSLVLDHSTLGEPGTPAITDTILAKIDGCFAFVADLTLVGKTKKIAKKAARREMPNPNVMLEYGWALKSTPTGELSE